MLLQVSLRCQPVIGERGGAAMTRSELFDHLPIEIEALGLNFPLGELVVVRLLLGAAFCALANVVDRKNFLRVLVKLPLTHRLDLMYAATCW